MARLNLHLLPEIPEDCPRHPKKAKMKYPCSVVNSLKTILSSCQNSNLENIACTKENQVVNITWDGDPGNIFSEIKAIVSEVGKDPSVKILVLNGEPVSMAALKALLLKDYSQLEIAE